jgi:DNA-binding NarL/FixJ family response regulator
VEPLRVLIAEDELLLREGLNRLLADAGFDVVGAAGDAPELLRKVAALAPDVAIIDVQMPPDHTDDGIRAAIAIRRDHPDVGVLVLSQFREEAYAMDLIGDNARGVGYLLKDRIADLHSFADAVRRVAGGGTVMDPEVIARLLARSAGPEGPVGRLSPRERKVLEVMAQGRSNAAIAQRLFITERAVAKHTASIFFKFDLQPSDDDNRRVLAVLAYLGSQTAW